MKRKLIYYINYYVMKILFYELSIFDSITSSQYIVKIS